MHGMSKTLTEMSLNERANMMMVVAESLETVAGEAEEGGDARFAANSMAIACTIRGCANDLSQRDLRAAELLLEQGIMLMHAYRTRTARLETVN
ncbi:hypothetical protein DTW90_31005 [Neorhizobium sp. P12A]|uniref:hypothetical protein n=1 Tax=Rhizobium/Agrobacterium group TaxID=227290 RepID=UPI0010493EDF|nr:MULTISPECIES: hypothetical protein [Rhizobium/Agrobacterium group]KAA0689545.1 hypothetical protein DTW90_31005 [Neorhizobium sp. P12A]TCR92701.1 hypothetical protein EV561_101137 [Rhizobium sp. BK376]